MCPVPSFVMPAGEPAPGSIRGRNPEPGAAGCACCRRREGRPAVLLTIDVGNTQTSWGCTNWMIPVSSRVPKGASWATGGPPPTRM